MTFTWNGDPGNSTLEEIRWYIDDTASGNVKFQDAEINYAYNQEGSVLGAAALLCEQLAAKYTKESLSRSLGPLRIDLTALAENYEKKAAKYRKRAQAYATPYAGNISKTDEETYEADTDIKQPIFEKDMHTNT